MVNIEIDANWGVPNKNIIEHINPIKERKM